MNPLVAESVLDEAARIVEGARQKNYGAPLDNWTNIARIWSVVLGIEVTAEQAALCMIGVKVARQAHRSHRDNLVDIPGYALVIEEIVNERERRHGNLTLLDTP